MKIKVIGTFESLVTKIEKKDKEFTTFLLKTAFLLNGKIQIRVQKNGLGSKGRSLKKYSKNYGIRRISTKRQASFRDLTWTGLMFQSLSAEVIGNKRVKMFFSGAEEASKAFFNDKLTPFFSLAPKERNFLNNELEAFVKL